MSEIKWNSSPCDLCGKCLKVCPFGAISIQGHEVTISSGCKFCKLCLKACPQGALELVEARKDRVNYEDYRGI